MPDKRCVEVWENTLAFTEVEIRPAWPSCITALLVLPSFPSAALAFPVSQRRHDVRRHIGDAVFLGAFTGTLGGQKWQLSVY